jgi:hypothetical protein
MSKKMYLLQVRVTPAPGGAQPHLAGGHGGVWVWTDSEDRVENEAEQYLLKYGWIPDSLLRSCGSRLSCDTPRYRRLG